VLNLLDKDAKLHNATLIMGLLEYTGTRQFYNSAIAIGNGSGLYQKRQLVPFGEYVPLEHFLRNLIAFFNLPTSHTVAGNAEQPTLISGNWKIAPLICYEIAYPDLARESALDGNVILTISNDTWFGQSLGPKQHLQIAQFRALETGRYVMRATNTGITAFINPKGEIISRAPAYETTVLTATIDTTAGLTPIVRLGHLWMVIGLFVLLAGSFLYSLRKVRD
jgi:apolipoprotein N-acyltransferase